MAEVDKSYTSSYQYAIASKLIISVYRLVATIFVTHQRTDMRYWYSTSVRLLSSSVCPSRYGILWKRLTHIVSLFTSDWTSTVRTGAVNWFCKSLLLIQSSSALYSQMEKPSQ